MLGLTTCPEHVEGLTIDDGKGKQEKIKKVGSEWWVVYY
jgi:hypothetical protein